MRNYSGEVYQNIEVLEKTNKRKDKGYVIYKCKCKKCGRIFENYLEEYRKRYKKGIFTMTCGCYDRHHNNFYKNGLSKTRIRFIYNNMKDRCYNKNSAGYKHYGKRGIKICKEWLEDFINFYNWAINNGYKESLSIDRIDVNGNYEPTNCKWSTFQEQIMNRTNTVKIEYNGINKPLTEWAREYKIPITTLRSRIDRGWNIERALKEKVHKNFKGKHSIKHYKYNNIEEEYE